MQLIKVGSLVVLTFGSAWAQPDVSIEMSPQEGLPAYWNIKLQFVADADRRYLIETSADLRDWTPHYLCPFEPSDEGYWVRQSEAAYFPTAEFYRVSALPWRFQTLVSYRSWIGDVVLSTDGSGEADLIFQDRRENKLYHSRMLTSGRFSPPAEIASTGLVDEPDFWDNSGYSEISMLHYAGDAFLVCTDAKEQRLLLMHKRAGSDAWTSHYISDVLPNYFWAFPKLAVSSAGRLGVAYSGNGGTKFLFADAADPTTWTNLDVTNLAASSSAGLQLMFEGSLAHVSLQGHGNFRISPTEGTAVAAPYPQSPASDLTPSDVERIAKMHRAETPSNHIRLSDGRLVIALSNGNRLLVAVETID